MSPSLSKPINVQWGAEAVRSFDYCLVLYPGRGKLWSLASEPLLDLVYFQFFKV